MHQRRRSVPAWRGARPAVAAVLIAAGVLAGCGEVAGSASRHAAPAGRLYAPTGIGASIGPLPYPGANTDGQAGSGGRAVAYHPGGQAITEAGVASQAPDALLFRTGYGSWEPTIGVNKRGTIFFEARTSNVDPGIVRSRDAGRTWENVNPPDHKVSLDPYMWVDSSTGRVFDTDIDPSVSCPPISATDDEGATWATHLACGVADHQSVFGGPPPAGGEKPVGYPNVVYYCAISGGALAGSSTITACLKSLDGGQSFQPSGDPAYPPKVTGDPNQPTCDGGAGHGVTDAKGTIYVPRGWCGPPTLAISRDEGKSWKQVTVADKPQVPYSVEDGAYAHESGVAVDRDGNVYYSWVGDGNHPYLAISRDGGATWGAPQDILPPGVDRMSGFTASIDVGDPGKIAIVLMGTPDPKTTPVDKTNWDGYVVMSDGALSSDPTFYAASINDPAHPLWKGACGAIRCGNVGDFFDIVIAPDGTPVAGLVDSCPGDQDRCTDFGVTNPRGEGIIGQLVGGPPLIGTRSDQSPGVVLSPPGEGPLSPAPSTSPPPERPSAHATCRRRRIVVRLRQPRRGRITSARVYVNGRRARSLTGRQVRGRRGRVVLHLRGLHGRRITVRVVVRTSSGRTLSRTRRYRSCGSKRKAGA